jgi:transcriptional regulator with XRE-family HTH domain
MQLKLKEYLSNSSLNQNQLAKKLGVSPIYISRWATGKVSPSLNYFYKISKILKVKMDDLLK